MISPFLSFRHSRYAWIHNPCVMFWCVSFWMPAWDENEELIWHLKNEAKHFFFLWCPSVQVKGGQLYSHVKKWNNIWLIQMRSEMLSVFCFSSPLCVFWVNRHFTPIPWLLLLCHTVPSLGATPKPGTCSHYCRLFTWHTLKPACILTPAPTACFGASFGLFYPFLAALFQLHLKKKKKKAGGGTDELQNFA